MNTQRPRVFSGIQPSGTPTIGNYIGAIRNWVRDQDRFENIFCVVDLHALTKPWDPADLRRNTRELAALLLASGIDPQRSLLFVQSHVHEHTQLTWILNGVAPMGWLNRMTQFKSKAGSDNESVSTGFYDYPVLMASDILLYHTNCVPVGEDQKQHVELTRDIAERFNSMFGETFTVPEPMIPRVGARIMALDNPAQKMDKSRPAGAVFMLDDSDTIRRKVGRAVTDSRATIRFDPQQAGLYNLLTIIQALSGETEEQILSGFEGQGYKEVKDRAAEVIIEALRPIQERFRAYEQSPEQVERILTEGAARAREIAAPLLAQAEERIGLWRPV
jgi:tryptophanyl-tRNA synthetase